MKKKIKAFLSATFLLGNAVLTGCVSIEEQLNSQSPAIRQIGEQRLLTKARLSGQNGEVLNAINRIQTKSLLLEIAKNANDRNIDEGKLALTKLSDEKDFSTLVLLAQSPEIRHIALSKISQQEILFSICTQVTDTQTRKYVMDKLDPIMLSRLPYSMAMVPYWKKFTNQEMLAKIYRDGYASFSSEDLTAITEKIKDQTILSKMVVPMSYVELDNAKRNRENEIFTLSREIKTLQDAAERKTYEANRAKKNWDFRAEKHARLEVANLMSKIIPLKKKLNLIHNSPATGLYITNDMARVKLYSRITESKIFEEILKSTDKNNEPMTKDQLQTIFRRIPEDVALKFTLRKLEEYDSYKWSNNKYWALEVASILTGVIKDSKTRIQIANAVIEKIESIKLEYKNHRNFLVRWTDEHESMAMKYTNMLSLSEDEQIEIMKMGNITGTRIVEIIGVETARKILSFGLSFNKEVEEKLVEKIPVEKIDLSLYESVKPGVAKAMLYKKMPENLRNAAQTSQEKHFAVIAEKAKVASKNTFALDGFYLGMSLDDLKTVLAYHFPRLCFTENRDKYGKEFVIVFSNENLPFCRATAKDRKVYCINFDKDILSNWYKYNAATHRTWAHAFGKENGMTMEYLEIANEATVLAGNDFKNVYLRQETWKHKNATKNILITYFGKPNLFGGNGGLSGALIKGEAWRQLSREGAAPEGTLRVEIID